MVGISDVGWEVVGDHVLEMVVHELRKDLWDAVDAADYGPAFVFRFVDFWWGVELWYSGFVEMSLFRCPFKVYPFCCCR